jgi:hypothetical protein
VHGLVNRSIQSFVTAMHGEAAWRRVAEAAGNGIRDYEALNPYSDADTLALLRGVERALGKPRARFLEDLGIWVVTSGADTPVRRLLRFCGPDFVEFLHSLDELPGRARLAVEGLVLPWLDLREHTASSYTVTLGPGLPGFGHVLAGILQAMADDYGALALIETAAAGPGGEVLTIRLFQAHYAAGTEFRLAGTR